MREVYRILDANFNRAREALRVAEDCGRFALNDPAITAMAKNLRSELVEVLSALPANELITSRDTPGDIGTELTSPTEGKRQDLAEVATVACKRLSESLRTIEEYGKFVASEQVTRVERMRYDAYTLEQRLSQRLMAGKRFAGAKLYVLVTSTMCKGSLRETARGAIAGGADVIQLRETNVTDDIMLALAAELRELTDEMSKLLIINNRCDIAALVAADGVHLGQSDLPIPEARKMLRPGAIVGKTVRNVDHARAAVNEGADYLSIGPIFKTTTKESLVPMGVEAITQVANATSLPLVAISGITAENAKEVIQAGADCVAVCSAVCGTEDPRAAAQAIVKQFD